jgi:hypothetical protein
VEAASLKMNDNNIIKEKKTKRNDGKDEPKKNVGGTRNLGLLAAI